MNNFRKVAVPVDTQDGLTAVRSGHFGHASMFTLVELDSGQIERVVNLPNTSHGAGGCMSVVKHLKANGVDTVIAAGMGGGPYQGLQSVGIEVLFADRKEHPDVGSVITALLDEWLTSLQNGQLCRGKGNCHRQQPGA